MPATSTSARWANIGTKEACALAGWPARLAERDGVEAQEQRRKSDEQTDDQDDREPGLARESRGHHQEFAGEDSKRRQSGDGHHAEHQAPAQNRIGLGQPAHVGDALSALDLRDVADRKEDRRLGERMHRHVQEPGEVGERSAHAEGEGDDAHVLDRGIGEHALDVAPPVQHERGEDERDQPHGHHQRAGRERRRIDRKQHLEAQQRVKRDVEQESRQHRRDRGRSLRVGIGQPRMQRREPHLGAVAEQQEHEGGIEQRRVETGGLRNQRGPHHRIRTLADDRLRRQIDQDGAEQRERDADAAKDEVFPGRLERFVGAVDADHEDGGERCQLDCDPHHADIVGDQSEIHRQHQHLIHRMIEAQERRGQPPALQLVADVGGAEHAGGEPHECGEHDEDVVEIVNVEIGAGLRADEEQRERDQESGEGGEHVEARGQPVTGQRRQQARRQRRNEQDCGQRVEPHQRSPRKRSSACRWTVSKRSRMRNRNIPITMKAIRIEKATLISTTSGMPRAPVAASTRPFSSDMKPTTWLTALRRVTIISRPSRTTESANARSSRASGSASAVTRSMTTIDSATRPMPSSIAVPTPTTFSISR